MSEFGSEVSGTEVSDVSETENVSEVSENEMDKDLSRGLDDVYDSYMKDDAEKFPESELNENDEVDELYEKMSDDIWSDIDSKCNSYIEDKEPLSETDNTENSPEQIKCRNEDLEGQRHPETGVPFERKQVEVDGKQYEIVVPEFESLYDAQLPENMYEAKDREQFKECNLQLKNEAAANKNIREQFDDEQLEQLENGDTPDGYTWHHDAEAGKMQLVDTEIHQKTGHTGGRSVWGGGTYSR